MFETIGETVSTLDREQPVRLVVPSNTVSLFLLRELYTKNGLSVVLMEKLM
jgi:hypothetical protein